MRCLFVFYAAAEINPQVFEETGSLIPTARTVRVNISADLSILFPAIVPEILVTQHCAEKLKAWTR